MAARLLATAPVVLAALLAAPAAGAQDGAERFLGRPITAVTLELGGAPFADRQVLELVETRPGSAFTMRGVRETLDHFVGIGRFDDVRVAATVAGDGVALRYVLRPVRRIRAIDFEGPTGLRAADLRAELEERHGATPSAARLDEMVATLRSYYRQRGYARADIAAVIEPGRTAEDVRAVFRVDAGTRMVVDRAALEGDAPAPAAEVLARLGLARGRPYDRVALEARLAAYADELRAAGYYEAVVSHRAVESEDGRSASVTVSIDAGRRVRVVFAGDPLPADRREALVPVRRERSVDEDLLEDASRNIEAYLRGEGYRAAEVSYARTEAGGELVLTFTVVRGPLHRIERVEVVGQQALGRADLAPLLRLEPGEPFVDARVAAVADAIAEIYRVRGFAAVTVTPDVRVRAAPAPGGARVVAVRFDVEEGARMVVGTVEFDGAEALAPDLLRARIGLQPGRPFYRPQLAADRETIERAYRNEGFQAALVTVSPIVADDGVRVDLRYEIREGPQRRVDHVLVTGNRRTSAETIRREITLRPGAPLGYEALIESQQRLSALGLFRRVRLTELAHSGSVNRDLLVEVEEAPATTVAYGGGVEVGQQLRRRAPGEPAADRVDVAPRGFFEIGRRNLWGKNRSVNLFTRVSLRPAGAGAADPTGDGGYGFNEYRLIGSFREPRALGTSGDAQVTGFVEQAIRASFNFNRRGVRAEYARRLGRGRTTTVSGRYAYDRTRLFRAQIAPEDQLLIDRLFPQVQLSTLAASILRDSRDDVLDPHRGAVLGVDGELAARALGSEVGYAKSFLQGFVYRRLPGPQPYVVAAGARVGLARGFARTVVRRDAAGQPVPGPAGAPLVDIVQDLPASERFFAGGDTTVRGFALDRLGTAATLTPEGFPAGGAGLVVANLELRAPYWRGLGLVGFLDAGNVFQRTGDIALGDLRAAAGFGVRYRSPLGPVRVDLGFKLDRRPLGTGLERRAVLHISLGQAF